MQPVALYVGSFDPVTNGHIDVVRHAAKLASRLVIAVGVHPGKIPLFSAEERLAMITETCAEMVRGQGCAFDCMTFDDLAVTTARRVGATLMIRGLRDGTDLDYEMQLAGMNAAMGGDVSSFVPAAVASRLTKKFPAIAPADRAPADKTASAGRTS